MHDPNFFPEVQEQLIQVGDRLVPASDINLVRLAWFVTGTYLALFAVNFAAYLADGMALSAVALGLWELLMLLWFAALPFFLRQSCSAFIRLRPSPLTGPGRRACICWAVPWVLFKPQPLWSWWPSLARPRRLSTAPRDFQKPKTQLMERHDIAIPILPSRSLGDTIAFFQRLGFEGHLAGDAYAILTRGGLELHFFHHPDLRPAESHAGCYIRVSDVEAIYKAFAVAGLPRRGIPRMDVLEDKPWGMKEFAVIDEDGNLLRVGQVL